jgi:hypothetical protein
MRSRDSSVVIVTGYGLHSRGSNPEKGKIFFSTRSIPVLRPTQSPIQLILGAISSGLKRPGREAHKSPPPSAEVKNDGAITPLPHKSSWSGT